MHRFPVALALLLLLAPGLPPGPAVAQAPARGAPAPTPAAPAAPPRPAVPAAATAGGSGAGGAAAAAAPAASEEVAAPQTPSRVPGLANRPAPSPDLPRPPADPGERRAWLKGALDEIFAAPALAKSKIGALVVEGDSGKVIYARSEKAPFNAASNVKLVTAAAALALLGPEYRWRTTVYAAGPPKGSALGAGGEIAGDLFIRGFGDPTLDSDDLAAIVGDLASMGVRRIKGGIVVDESFFDGTHVGPAYDQKPESSVSRAPSAAASLDGNVVGVTVVPGGKAGAAARVLVHPSSSYFTVAGRIVTAASGPAVSTVETREDTGGKTQILVSGRIRLGSEPRSFHRRVTNPPLYLGYTLKALLERRGIAVGQTVRLGTVPASGMRVVAAHDSAPLGVVVHDLNKRSNNFAAEQVLRTLGAEILGRPGTWDKGIEAVGRYLGTLGVRKGSYQMTNGSGLYDSNRFSPEQLVSVLRGAMRDFRIAAEFMASLAVAGTDGTIGHRMGGTAAERFVRAKTGTLASASCLSGYAGSPGRPPLVFSILMNDVPGSGEARRAQDRAAELLVSYIEADPPPRP